VHGPWIEQAADPPWTLDRGAAMSLPELDLWPLQSLRLHRVASKRDRKGQGSCFHPHWRVGGSGNGRQQRTSETDFGACRCAVWSKEERIPGRG
jgi:hypothetical protein